MPASFLIRVGLKEKIGKSETPLKAARLLQVQPSSIKLHCPVLPAYQSPSPGKTKPTLQRKPLTDASNLSTSKFEKYQDSFNSQTGELPLVHYRAAFYEFMGCDSLRNYTEWKTIDPKANDVASKGLSPDTKPLAMSEKLD